MPNPSFEERDGCPQFYPDLDGVCKEWISFRETPDYFHYCSSVCGYNNQWGYQEPHSGLAYAGFVTFFKNFNSREHLGVKIKNQLEIGKKYYLTFFVSAGFNNGPTNVVTNKIGALLTTYSYNDPSGILPLPNTATVYTNTIVTDTSYWIKISGSFLADSSYTYLILGVFFDDNNIDTLYLKNNKPPEGSYYFVDDVCLSTDSVYATTWTSIENVKKQNPITSYPNPSSGILKIKSEYFIEKIEIFNSLGQLVFKEQPVEKLEHEINLTHLPTGSYNTRISNSRETINNKLILNNQR
ncbi:MAG: T9SS type A sorting domain-containing protein [Bacteroidetes bacterium]|nr:T9SS type A sorting domain-containing protein [Bacteroidota bacterium]